MKKRTGEILKILDDMYGTDLVCYLDHENAWQLLVATILSAQCTDARVNIVTKDLFVRYPSIRSLAEAELPELEQYIKSTGGRNDFLFCFNFLFCHFIDLMLLC